MKKILIFLALFLPVLINAQDVNMDKSQWKASYTGLSTDLVNGATSLSKVFLVNKYEDMYYVTVQADIDTSDSQATTGNVTVTLAGSYDGTNYTTIASAVTYGCTVDTILTIHNKSYTETVASTIAQHTETIAAHNEIRRGTLTNGAYTSLGTGTLTTASYLGVYDTASANADTITFGTQTMTRADTLTHSAQTVTCTDTVAVGAQTNTVAAQTITTTNTLTQPGCDYDYIRLTLLGTAAGVHVELQAIEIKLTKVPR